MLSCLRSLVLTVIYFDFLKLKNFTKMTETLPLPVLPAPTQVPNSLPPTTSAGAQPQQPQPSSSSNSVSPMDDAEAAVVQAPASSPSVALGVGVSVAAAVVLTLALVGGIATAVVLSNGQKLSFNIFT